MSVLSEFPRQRPVRRPRHYVQTPEGDVLEDQFGPDHPFFDEWDGSVIAKPSRTWRIEEAVLEEIAKLGERRTTNRFLFYRLLSRGVITKSDSDVNALSNVMTQLRDSAVIPMSQIVDGTREITDWHYWNSVHEAAVDAAKSARLNPWVDHAQPQLWVESRSLAGVLEDIAYTYRVPLVPLGGQASRSLAWEVAQTVTDKTPILYLGDADKSGHHIEEAFITTVSALVHGDHDIHVLRKLRDREQTVPVANLNVTRLAVTPEQIVEFELPVMMKKDMRDGNTYEAVETEALPQEYIEELVESELRALCPVSLKALTDRAKAEREKVLDLLGDQPGQSPGD